MISYDSTNDKSNTANKKSEQKKQHKVLLIDIRPWEEYPYFCSVYISPYKELPNIVQYHICTYVDISKGHRCRCKLTKLKF